MATSLGVDVSKKDSANGSSLNGKDKVKRKVKNIVRRRNKQDPGSYSSIEGDFEQRKRC